MVCLIVTILPVCSATHQSIKKLQVIVGAMMVTILNTPTRDQSTQLFLASVIFSQIQSVQMRVCLSDVKQGICTGE